DEVLDREGDGSNRCDTAEAAQIPKTGSLDRFGRYVAFDQHLALGRLSGFPGNPFFLALPFLPAVDAILLDLPFFHHAFEIRQDLLRVVNFRLFGDRVRIDRVRIALDVRRATGLMTRGDILRATL